MSDTQQASSDTLSSRFIRGAGEVKDDPEHRLWGPAKWVVQLVQYMIAIIVVSKCYPNSEDPERHPLTPRSNCGSIQGNYQWQRQSQTATSSRVVWNEFCSQTLGIAASESMQLPITIERALRRATTTRLLKLGGCVCAVPLHKQHNQSTERSEHIRRQRELLCP